MCVSQVHGLNLFFLKHRVTIACKDVKFNVIMMQQQLEQLHFHYAFPCPSELYGQYVLLKSDIKFHEYSSTVQASGLNFWQVINVLKIRIAN